MSLLLLLVVATFPIGMLGVIMLAARLEEWLDDLEPSKPPTERGTEWGTEWGLPDAVREDSLVELEVVSTGPGRRASRAVEPVDL